MPNVVDIQVDTFKQRVATILMVRVYFPQKKDNMAWTMEKFLFFPLYKITGFQAKVTGGYIKSTLIFFTRLNVLVCGTV
jgi:hypothetical protein